MKLKVISSFFLLISTYGSLYSEEWKELYRIDPQDQSKILVGRYNRDDTDPFGAATIGTLVDEAKDEGLHFIIAQATFTDDTGREVVKTYEAIPLFRHLFGPNFLFPEEHRFNTAHDAFSKKDPLARESYIGAINLFFLKEDGTGEYIGNDLQLHSKPSSQQATKIAQYLLGVFGEGLINEYLQMVKTIYEEINKENNPELEDVYFRNLTPYLFTLNLKRDSLKPTDLQFIETIINTLPNRNFKTASTYLIPAAEQNINQEIKILAQYNIGQIYLEGGYGVQQNFQTALTYLEPAAQQNINQKIKILAQYNIGQIYLVGGYGVEQDFQAALTYLEPAAEQNINQEIKVLAQYDIGGIYLEGGHDGEQDFQAALTYLEPAAEQDINQELKILTQFDIGGIYLKGGHGVEQNFQTALTYLEPAAEQNINPNMKAQAQHDIGGIYFVGGHGVQQNFQTALNYLEPVAQQNIDQNSKFRAQYYIGKIYFEGGHGVQQNFQTALNYLEPVAQQNIDQNAKMQAENLIQNIQASISEEPAYKKQK